MAQTTYILSLRDKVTRAAHRVQRSLGGITRSARSSSTAMNAIGLAAGGAAAMGFFKLGAELESTMLKFNTLSGSVEKGTALFNELKDFANTTPFTNTGLNKNASTMLAFGATSKNVTNSLRMLGDVAAGDQERLNSLTLAFSQSRSAGKLMGQDLLQFTNAGFNPLQQLAKMWTASEKGLSMEQLNKGMEDGSINMEKLAKKYQTLKKASEKGLIPFSFIEKAFKSATSKGGKFYEMTLKMSKTMAGRYSTAVGKMGTAMGEFSLAMKGFWVPILESVIWAIDKFKKFREAHVKLVNAIAGGIGTFLAVAAAIGVVTFAVTTLSAALFANPIVAVIGLLAGLTVALQEVTDNGTTFGATLGIAWARMKYDARAIADLFTGLAEGISKSLQAIEIAIKTGNFHTVKKLFSESGDAFAGAFKTTKANVEQYEKDVVGVMNSMKEKVAAVKTGAETAEMGGLNFNFDEEMKKLQAEGIVSGGALKVFNINISNLTGVGTLTTTNMNGGAQSAGEAVNRALLEALADIKNI